MALPLLFIFHMGRIIPIGIRIGTALARFVAKNPGIVGGTISVQAISAAIQSHESTEKEKIEIANEIGKENPQLRADLLKNIFHPGTDPVSNIIPYLVVIIIIYFIINKK